MNPRRQQSNIKKKKDSVWIIYFSTIVGLLAGVGVVLSILAFVSNSKTSDAIREVALNLNSFQNTFQTQMRTFQTQIGTSNKQIETIGASFGTYVVVSQKLNPDNLKTYVFNLPQWKTPLLPENGIGNTKLNALILIYVTCLITNKTQEYHVKAHIMEHSSSESKEICHQSIFGYNTFSDTHDKLTISVGCQLQWNTEYFVQLEFTNEVYPDYNDYVSITVTYDGYSS